MKNVTISPAVSLQKLNAIVYVCVYVCVCVCLYRCRNPPTPPPRYTLTHTSKHHTHTHTHARTHTHTPTRAHIDTHTHTHIHKHSHRRFDLSSAMDKDIITTSMEKEREPQGIFSRGFGLRSQPSNSGRGMESPVLTEKEAESQKTQ